MERDPRAFLSNRLGKGANIYLSPAELADVAAMMGRIPTVAEYMEAVKGLQPMAGISTAI